MKTIDVPDIIVWGKIRTITVKRIRKKETVRTIYEQSK